VDPVKTWLYFKKYILHACWQLKIEEAWSKKQCDIHAKNIKKKKKHLLVTTKINLNWKKSMLKNALTMLMVVSITKSVYYMSTILALKLFLRYSISFFSIVVSKPIIYK